MKGDEQSHSIPQEGEIWLQGQAVVSGIAIGMPFFLRQFCSKEVSHNQHSSAHELEQFQRAVAQNQTELQKLSQELFSAGLLQEADLVEGSLFLATDPVFLDQVEERIRSHGKKAIQAIEEVRSDFRARFKTLPNPYLQQRFEDVDGVCDRLIALLDADNSAEASLKISADAILCAQSVTAPLAAQVSVNGIGAIVTMCGGAMSHTAIVARSRGIPYISDIDIHSVKNAAKYGPIIVDGMAGVVILRPREETLKRYLELKIDSSRSQLPEHFKSHEITGVTKDGVQIKILANVSKETDIYQIPQYTLDGVGLYRTEYQVLEKCRFPSEEEQFKVYAEMVQASRGRPLVIRVFDFGSDKGWEEIFTEIPEEIRQKRALSLLLECPDIFRTQLRAVLKASRLGPLSILFPMVTSLIELDRSLDLLQEVYHEVSQEGSLRFPEIGAMLEIPSILFHTQEIARRVDFLSLGTNDLTQYALAVDRSNSAAFDYRISFHPGLMHLIWHAVKESEAANVPLCICGEMASDPLLVPFLVGLGVTKLSMAPRFAPMVRNVLQSFTRKEMKEIAEKVLVANSAQEIYVILRTFYALVNVGDA